MLKKIFFVFIFVFIFNKNIYGADLNQLSQNKALDFKIFIFDNINVIADNDERDKKILFFSSAKYQGVVKGNVYLFFSNLEINETVVGNVYSFFSSVKISENGGANNIQTFSSKISFPENLKINVSSYFDLFLKESVLEKEKNINDTIPYMLIFFIFLVFRIIISICLIFFKESFFQQGFGTVKNDSVLIIFKNGIIGYFIIGILFLVFIISLIGIPFSILITILYLFFALLGEISLGIYIGNLITKNFIKIPNIFLDSSIGIILIRIVMEIPLIKDISRFILMPIVFLGIIITTIMNGYMKKIFYETPYINKKIFDSKKINDILL